MKSLSFVYNPSIKIILSKSYLLFKKNFYFLFFSKQIPYKVMSYSFFYIIMLYQNKKNFNEINSALFANLQNFCLFITCTRILDESFVVPLTLNCSMFIA